MRKFFTMVLATVAATTMAFAAVQETTQSVDCGTSKTIVATPATGYHFVRWEKDGSAIAGDATLTITDISAAATYEAIFAINTYTIRFMNGTEVLQTSTVEHGQTPAYSGATPTKAQTAQYTYSFSGWSPEVAFATADQDYVAQFTETLRSYTITFKNEDGTTLQSGLVAYGTTPTYTGATPTKAQDAQYTYTFAGWDSEIVAVNGEKTYTATFTPNLRSYTITFKNYDGTVLQTLDAVDYGTTPVYTGATPTKASDTDYNYVWDGWTPTISVVTGEATYEAHFNAVPKDEFVVGVAVNPEGTGHVDGGGTYKDGATATLTAVSDDSCYEFEKWADDNSTNPTRVITVTGNVTYTAIFKKIPYSITIKSGDDTKGTVSFQ